MLLVSLIKILEEAKKSGGTSKWVHSSKKRTLSNSSVLFIKLFSPSQKQSLKKTLKARSIFLYGNVKNNYNGVLSPGLNKKINKK